MRLVLTGKVSENTRKIVSLNFTVVRPTDNFVQAGDQVLVTEVSASGYENSERALAAVLKAPEYKWTHSFQEVKQFLVRDFVREKYSAQYSASPELSVYLFGPEFSL